MKKKHKIIIPVFLLFFVILISILAKNIEKESTSPEPYIKLYLHNEAMSTTLPLEEYIIGAVSAEMPASFEKEALKAQAVCARTYAIRKLLDEKAYPQNADLSDDIQTCQAFISRQNYERLHPNLNSDMRKRVEEAVASTRGEIIVYNGEPADAVYHSCCGGRTASAKAVWGTDIAYLQGEKCNYCAESKHYRQEKIFSKEALSRQLKVSKENLHLISIPSSRDRRTEKIELNGKEMSAAIIRSRLDLPSTWMYFTERSKDIRVETRGYGHGVGLCQYGANGMAQKGYDYQEILKKYYRGIDLYKIPY